MATSAADIVASTPSTTAAATTGTTTTASQSGISLGAGKAFIVAHPIGVAVVGGALVGLLAYYLVKKLAK